MSLFLYVRGLVGAVNCGAFPPNAKKAIRLPESRRCVPKSRLQWKLRMSIWRKSRISACCVLGARAEYMIRKKLTHEQMQPLTKEIDPAMANMSAVCYKYRYTVKPFLIVPIIGAMFADLINTGLITLFLNLISRF